MSFGGSAESYSLLAAGSYEFTQRGAIQPYVGAALGVATMVLDINFEGQDFLEGSATSLAARGFAGASVKLTRDTSLFVEGQYNYVGPFQLAGENGLKFDDSFRGWGAGVGLRFAI
jgi:opacity protein-like surface antigen